MSIKEPITKVRYSRGLREGCLSPPPDPCPPLPSPRYTLTRTASEIGLEKAGVWSDTRIAHLINFLLMGVNLYIMTNFESQVVLDTGENKTNKVREGVRLGLVTLGLGLGLGHRREQNEQGP